jgi:putative DNA primase/helicase
MRGERVTRECPAGRYLESRAIVLDEYPAMLRYVARTNAASKDEPAIFCPAMIATVTDANRKRINVHRTFISHDVSTRKKLMPGKLPTGSAIRLFPSAETLGIAEGIETALSAFVLFGVPTWSAVNAQNLAKWTPPKNTKRVIVFGDNDPKFAGHAAAWTCAHQIALTDIAVEVRIPERTGDDWNDVLMRQTCKRENVT